jgi:hypothetical protein
VITSEVGPATVGPSVLPPAVAYRSFGGSADLNPTRRHSAPPAPSARALSEPRPAPSAAHDSGALDKKALKQRSGSAQVKKALKQRSGSAPRKKAVQR